MESLELIFILGNVIMAGYLLAMLIVEGITKSISATFYDLPQGAKWLFKMALIGYSVPMIIVGFESSWFAMAGVFIIFTALAANAKKSDDIEDIHVIGATGGIILVMMGILFADSPQVTKVFWEISELWWIPVIQAVFTGAAMKFEMRNRTYFIELLAIILTSYALDKIYL